MKAVNERNAKRLATAERVSASIRRVFSDSAQYFGVGQSSDAVDEDPTLLESLGWFFDAR